MFPEPPEQARAIGMFATAATIGNSKSPDYAKVSQLDFVGAFTRVSVPLFVSIGLVVAFFVWETRVDERDAALITGGLITINSERIARLSRPKIFVLGDPSLVLAGTLMLPFSDKLSDKYWLLVFPALIISTPRTATIFVLTNISLFRKAPPEYAGTVGAVFNAALQLGAAIGTSATTSIRGSVDERTHSGPGFTGRPAALWFLIDYVVLDIVGVAVFYREERSLSDLEAKTLEVGG